MNRELEGQIATCGERGHVLIFKPDLLTGLDQCLCGTVRATHVQGAEMKKFQTEAAAREHAKKNDPDTEIAIIESRGEFFLEANDDSMMLRNYERECYRGIGRLAVPKKGYFTCRRCASYNPHPADVCRRCGLSADAGVPKGIGL